MTKRRYTSDGLPFRSLDELDEVVAGMIPAFHEHARRAITNEWGERCDEYEPGCPCCDAWRFFDRYGICPTVQQVRDFQRTNSQE